MREGPERMQVWGEAQGGCWEDVGRTAEETRRTAEVVEKTGRMWGGCGEGQRDWGGCRERRGGYGKDGGDAGSTREDRGGCGRVCIGYVAAGISTIRGTEFQSPHGIPVDLLDRLMIIPTEFYKKEDILDIIKIRCEEEDIEMESDASALLASLGLSGLYACLWCGADGARLGLEWKNWKEGPGSRIQPLTPPPHPGPTTAGDGGFDDKNLRGFAVGSNFVANNLQSLKV